MFLRSPDSSQPRVSFARHGRAATTLVAAAVAVALTGCDSGGGSSSGGGMNDIDAQAIDGYIVGANVFCDGVAHEPTEAGGFFTCPEGTELMQIEGGQDVGFDAAATEGGDAFTGVLKAPGTLVFVTPLSTVAVELSVDADGNFDPAAVETALVELADALGVDALDLNIDPTTEGDESALAIAKLNAQIHQIVSAFAGSTEEYGQVVRSLAISLKNAASTAVKIDLLKNSAKATADLMRSLNSELRSRAPGLSKDESDLEGEIETVKSTNENIAKASDLKKTVDVVRSAPTRNAYVKFDRDELEVEFVNRDIITSDDDDDQDVFIAGAENSSTSYDLDDFENDQRNLQGHYTVSFTSALDRLGFARDGLDVQRGGNDVRIGLGFEVEALAADDDRKLSLTTRGAKVSMAKGDPASIVVEVPDGTVLNAKSMHDGGEKAASWTKSGNSVFKSTANFIDVDIRELNRRLTSKGIDGFLDRPGSYKVTLVLDGIKIGVKGSKGSFDDYRVETDRQAVSGAGVRGYVTYVD